MSPLNDEMKRTILTILLIYTLFLATDAKDRALLVGIGNYDTRTTGWSVIHGDNDVDMLDERLIRKGYKAPADTTCPISSFHSVP